MSVVQSQSQDDESLDSFYLDDVDEEEHRNLSAQGDDNTLCHPRNANATDLALSESVRILCHRSSILPNVMQNFG